MNYNLKNTNILNNKISRIFNDKNSTVFTRGIDALSITKYHEGILKKKHFFFFNFLPLLFIKSLFFFFFDLIKYFFKSIISFFHKKIKREKTYKKIEVKF